MVEEYEQEIFSVMTKEQVEERQKKIKERTCKYVKREYIKPDMEILRKKIRMISKEEKLKKENHKAILLA